MVGELSLALFYLWEYNSRQKYILYCIYNWSPLHSCTAVRLVEVLNWPKFRPHSSQKDDNKKRAWHNNFHTWLEFFSDWLVFEDYFLFRAQHLLCYFVPKWISCKLILTFKKILHILLQNNKVGMHTFFRQRRKFLSSKVGRNYLSGVGNSDILRLFPVVGDNLPRPPIDRLHTVVEVSGLNQVT